NRRQVMYSRVSIKNFRGIESLEADELRRINLIVGRNNSGKTTFLEGVFLVGGTTNPAFPTTLGQLRGQRLIGTYPDPIWRALFRNLDPETPIEILGQWAEEPRGRKLTIQALGLSNYVEPIEEWSGSEADILALTQDRVITWLQLRYRYAEGDE